MIHEIYLKRNGLTQKLTMIGKDSIIVFKTNLNNRNVDCGLRQKLGDGPKIRPEKLEEIIERV